MAIITGEDFVITAITGAGVTPTDTFAHCNSATIDISGGLIETTTKDSGGWMDNIYGKKSFTVQVDGLADYAALTNQFNVEDIADALIAGNTISFTIGITGSVYTGDALIDSVSISGGTVAEAATYSLSLTGTGALA